MTTVDPVSPSQSRADHEATDAPEFFVQTSFAEAESGRRYLVTVAGDDHIWIRGDIRAGRSLAARRALMRSIMCGVARITGLDAQKIWVYLNELEPTDMIEYGHMLPAPSEEQAWFESLRRHCVSISRASGQTARRVNYEPSADRGRPVKGYIYITGVGNDPGLLGNLTDPMLFADPPTLGACMPNIRRFVEVGDYIFVISGKTKDVRQYLIGGFKVAEKIEARDAYARFPSGRLRKGADGRVCGNIIVDGAGRQHPLDSHKPAEFAGRTHDFVVGSKPMLLATPKEVERGRAESTAALADICGKAGERPIDIIGRMKKLDERQVQAIVDWLCAIRRDAR